MTEIETYQSLMTQPNAVFVFGSNLRGAHGAGAAAAAMHHYGARYGQAEGVQGRSYAIPTKDFNLRTLPLARIWHYVEEFLNFADQNRDLTFVLTRVGCVLAGYTDEDIAPMFETASPNVILPEKWKALLSQPKER